MEIDEIKQSLADGFRAAEEKAAKTAAEFDQKLKSQGDVNIELRNALDAAVSDMKSASDRLMELEQKGVRTPVEGPQILSIGQAFVASAEFKSIADGSSQKGRAEVKNTLLSNGNTVLPQQVQDVRGGPERPLTVYESLPHAPASSNQVEGLRETAFTNNAAETAEGALKPESELTFGPWDFPVRTIAHWIKVSRNLLADHAALAARVDSRLRYGVLERVDKQIVIGNGTSPNLSGLLNPGNFTVYTPAAGDNLIDAINKAKWRLWAAGWLPDKVYVNPADWGAMETAKGTDGHYLYGLPGTLAAFNQFNVQIIPSPWVPVGQFIIGAFNRAVTVWDRESVVVEAGYVDDDFTRNLITLRAEARVALEITTPGAILGGPFKPATP